MRHLAIATLGLVLAFPAFAHDRASTHGHPGRKGTADTSAAYEASRTVVAPDTNAPGNNWGKKEVVETKPRTCSYDGAMSDKDIERCRR